MDSFFNYAVTWTGQHISTLDGRVIQVGQFQEFKDEVDAREFVLTITLKPEVSSVRLWKLVEGFPYLYDGKHTTIQEL